VIISAMDGRLPLPTLLSHALVAFTIEFDNESERQMAHRTTWLGGLTVHAPWLVSLVMWSNCMRFVDENGLPVGELERRARTTTNLAGMQRWGYITIEKDPADRRPKPPRSAWVIRATPVGRKAREVWQPLIHAIEKRWQQRFGKDEIAELRESLWAVARQLDLELPDCLSILGYGRFSKRPDYERWASARSEDSPLPLPALLSRVLLAFAIEFETESDLSFAISADIARVLDEKGVRLRDIPLLTGVSKEAVSMGMGILRKKRLAVVEPDPSGIRAKVARLTPKGSRRKGRISSASHQHRTALAGTPWQGHHPRSSRAAGAIGWTAYRAAVASIPRIGTLPRRLASVGPQAETLPHYPMVLHRGGFPDGS
jgi:DNA-binding MarR family transcriptional regulator